MRSARSASADVQRAGVGVGVDRHAVDTGLAAGADDADRDLAAVGDEHALQGAAPLTGHRASTGPAACRGTPACRSGLRRSPGAARWSPPSGLRRRAAGRPATCAISAFAAETAPGADVTSSRTYRSIVVSRSASAQTACTRPISRARAAVETRSGEKQLTRRRRADLCHGERRDHRGKDAQLGLGETELRGVARHDDVADGGEAGASAERGAVDAADQRNRQRIERLEHRGHRLGVADVLVVRVADHLRHPGQVGAGAEVRCPRRGEWRRARPRASGPSPTPSAPRSAPR